MEIRTTPTAASIHDRDTSELHNDLCLALRDVIVWNGDLPDGETVKERIAEVKLIFAEISRRGSDVKAALQELSEETDWNMELLLADCLGYPERIPYEKDRNGVRRIFRCILCQAAEFPEGRAMELCDGCLERTVGAIESRTPIEGILLYRTYNEEKRCSHADGDTVLAVVHFEDDRLEAGSCKLCYLEEKQARGAL